VRQYPLVSVAAVETINSLTSRGLVTLLSGEATKAETAVKRLWRLGRIRLLLAPMATGAHALVYLVLSLVRLSQANIMRRE
jgi:hypothetical protein